MNFIDLAQAAVKETASFEGTLSADLIFKMRLAYVAQWLHDQETVSGTVERSRAADAACAAIGYLRNFYR